MNLLPLLLACAAFADPVAAPAAPPAPAKLYAGDVKKGEIELLEQVQIFGNKWVLFFNDKVRFPNGKEGTYNRVSRPQLTGDRASGSAVLAFTEKGEVVMENVFRHPIRQWTWELPRGGWEPGETLEGTARRELLEETGFECKTWRDLGAMFPDTGLTDYSVRLFEAKGCARKARATEEEEAIKAQLIPWKKARAMAVDGEIKDSISLSAILRSEKK